MKVTRFVELNDQIKIGMGSRFLFGNLEYILSLTEIRYNKNTSTDYLMCLISLDDGNRWQSPSKVDDYYDISFKEFQKITGKDAFGRWIYLKDGIKYKIIG
jgi:hypothetical protein